MFFSEKKNTIFTSQWKTENWGNEDNFQDARQEKEPTEISQAVGRKREFSIKT